jgi:Fe-S cluster biogenesis protein NfuA
MTNMQPLDPREFQEELHRLDVLIREVDGFTDPAAAATVRELVQAVLALHRSGLERLLEHVVEREAGTGILDACVRDEVVSGLLLLHELHPLNLDARVQQALEEVRPYLRTHGGNVELLGVVGGRVRLRLQGSCHSCPSSSLTMKQTIEQAILARAPDALGVEVDGMVEALPTRTDGATRIALTLV